MNECFLSQKRLTELMNINWKKNKNKIKKNCVKRLQIQPDTGYVSGTPKLWWITNKTFGYPEVLLECSGHSYNEVSALKPCLNFRLSTDARCMIAVFIPAAVWNYYCVHTHMLSLNSVWDIFYHFCTNIVREGKKATLPICCLITIHIDHSLVPNTSWY